jgi:hypothetical protein
MWKAILILGLIFGGALIAVMYTVVNEDVHGGIIPPTGSPLQTVALTAQYQNGVHRYYGEVKLPHSCYSLDRSIGQSPDDPNIIRITLVSKDKTGQLSPCAQVTTGYPFDLFFPGRKDMRPEILLDGNILPLVVTEREWGTGRPIIPGENTPY